MTATGRASMIIAAILSGSVLTSCVASALVDVATAPVRAVGKGIDLATTSQSEADEKRGREMRRREERLDRLEREYARDSRRCEEGDDDACRRAEDEREAMRDLAPSIPYEAER